MTRIHVVCEGQTEETFIREVMYDYFIRNDIYLNPFLVRTSAVSKGGVVKYSKIKPQLERKCLEDKTAYVTTMFDLFRLPKDFPGKSTMPPSADPFEKANYLEQQLGNDIGHNNFIPNLLVHEFEGLLYSDPQAFSNWFDSEAVSHLTNERQNFKSPEHINDGPETAPSKRIVKRCPDYEKPHHGSLIALEIGIDKIREECMHFDTWLNRLSNLSGDNDL